MADGRRASLEDELKRLASRIVAEEGLELVEFALRGAGGRQVLRLDVDKVGPQGVALEHCERVSRTLSALLDESDLIPFRYVLEVSSPGADRPIRSDDDIRRNVGRRVVVTTSDDERSRRSVHGVLLGCEDGYLVLAGEDEEKIRVPLEGIVETRQEVGF